MSVRFAQTQTDERRTALALADMDRAVGEYAGDLDPARGEFMGDGIPRTAEGVPYDPETGKAGPGAITMTRKGRTARLVGLNDIDTSKQNFLWYPWLNQGLDILVGYGGSRKSTFAAYMCAQATRGLLTDQDDNKNNSRHVVYISQGEDDLNSVLVPRLLAQGCDPEYTHILQVSVTDPFGEETVVGAGREDLDAIKAMCRELKPALVVFDPLSLLINGDINSYQDVQPALVACNSIGKISGGAAVLGIHHWNKNGGFTGSQKFQDTARSFMEIAVDPDDKTASIVSLTKANNSDKPSLRLTADLVPYTCSDGSTTTVQIIRTVEQSRLSVDDLRQSSANGDDADDMNEQERWLVRYLKANDGKAAYKDILDAGRKDGFSRDQLKRAKKRLHVTSCKGTFQGATYWQLPTEEPR